MGGSYTTMTNEQYERSRFARYRKAEEKVKSAMAGLRRQVPFFSVQVMRKPVEITWEVPTLCTDGTRIRIGAEWVLNTDMWEVESGIIHEKFHDNLLHHLRRGNRDFETWNIAGDYVVNYNMKQAGFQIGKDWLYDERIGSRSITQAYDILWEKKKQEAERNGQPPPQPQGPPQPGQGSGQPQPGQPNTPGEKPKYFGEVRDMPSEKGEGQKPSEDEIRAAEADEKMAMTVAMNVAKRAGKLPGHIQRIVMVKIKGELSWREAVASWKATIIRDDYSWRRPNNKYVQYGMYLPELYNETIDNLVVMCDTSGSIDSKMLREMIGDIHTLMSTFNIQNMKVLYIDSEINGIEEWSVSEDCKPNPKGGGGTSFRPGFEWMEKNDEQPVGVIYITDGYCSRFPREEPECPVLWVIVDGYNESFRPPFGEVVYRHLD